MSGTERLAAKEQAKSSRLATPRGATILMSSIKQYLPKASRQVSFVRQISGHRATAMTVPHGGYITSIYQDICSLDVHACRRAIQGIDLLMVLIYKSCGLLFVNAVEGLVGGKRGREGKELTSNFTLAAMQTGNT